MRGLCVRRNGDVVLRVTTLIERMVARDTGKRGNVVGGRDGDAPATANQGRIGDVAGGIFAEEVVELGIDRQREGGEFLALVENEHGKTSQISQAGRMERRDAPSQLAHQSKLSLVYPATARSATTDLLQTLVGWTPNPLNRDSILRHLARLLKCRPSSTG